MNKIPFIISAVFLSCLALFSVFGFLASGELAAAAALPWKIGYATLFVLSLLGTIASLKKTFRKTP